MITVVHRLTVGLHHPINFDASKARSSVPTVTNSQVKRSRLLAWHASCPESWRVDPDRDHPTRWAARRRRRLDLHPPPSPRQVERVDHAIVGQVEDRARSITLRARRLEHGSWSPGSWMSSQHPSQQGHEPSPSHRPPHPIHHEPPRARKPVGEGARRNVKSIPSGARNAVHVGVPQFEA